MQYNPDDFDVKNFKQDAYSLKIDKPWGWEVHFVPAGKPYMGKILHINAGQRLSPFRSC